jgi:hypothetical protein
LLPLLGTWVGTILAFYFSKENFEAASRSVTEMAKQMTPQQKLAATPVQAQMVPKARMFFATLPDGGPGGLVLTHLLEESVKAAKGDRIPVLSKEGKPVYMIHRSAIDRYLTEKALATPPPDLKSLTLQGLLADPKLSGWLTGFATVGEDATMADAKEAMDRLPDCQDVFVTKGGTREGAVVGLVTNVMIESIARV